MEKKLNSNTVSVERLFATTIGLIAILKFPSEIFPIISMQLKNEQNLFLIEQISFNKPNELINPDENFFSCNLKKIVGNIKEGDVFEIQYIPPNSVKNGG